MVELASTKWNIWWGWSTRWRSAWRRRWWWWNWFLSFFQYNESFALDQVHSNDPWDPAWVQLVQEVRGRPAGGLWGVQVNLTWSPLQMSSSSLFSCDQLNQIWQSCPPPFSSLFSERDRANLPQPARQRRWYPTGGENYFCEHYCREFRWCEEMRIFVIHCNRMASQYSDSKNSSSGDWFCEALKITIKNHIDKVIKMLEKAKLHFVDFGLWSSRLSLNPETHLRCFSF